MHRGRRARPFGDRRVVPGAAERNTHSGNVANEAGDVARGQVVRKISVTYKDI